LNIGNKISPLPIWRYTSKPRCCVTPTNNNYFQQNPTSTVHHLLAIKVPNFSKIYQSKQ